MTIAIEPGTVIDNRFKIIRHLDEERAQTKALFYASAPPETREAK